MGTVLLMQIYIQFQADGNLELFTYVKAPI